MKVICEKYNVCTGCNCGYKKLHNWNGIDFIKMNYCYHIQKNVDFLTEKELRKLKLEKINEGNL